MHPFECRMPVQLKKAGDTTQQMWSCIRSCRSIMCTLHVTCMIMDTVTQCNSMYVLLVLFAIIINHTSCLYHTASIIINCNHTYNTKHAVFCYMRLCTVCICMRHHVGHDVSFERKQEMNVSILVHFKVSIVSASSLPGLLNG